MNRPYGRKSSLYVAAHANEQPKKKKIDLYAIAELAPFLDEEYLNKLMLDADLNDLDGLDELAPFLSKDSLVKLAKYLLDQQQTESISELKDYL